MPRPVQTGREMHLGTHDQGTEVMGVKNKDMPRFQVGDQVWLEGFTCALPSQPLSLRPGDTAPLRLSR